MSAIYRSPFPGSPSTTLLFSYIEQTLHLLKINKFCDECCILITILQCRHESAKGKNERRGKEIYFSNSLSKIVLRCVYLSHQFQREKKPKLIHLDSVSLLEEEFQTCNKCVVWWYGGNLSNNDSIADMKLSNFRKEEGSLIHDAAKSLTCFYNFLPYSLLS